jgi:FtsH-binding integral membrane protein
MRGAAAFVLAARASRERSAKAAGARHARRFVSNTRPRSCFASRHMPLESTFFLSRMDCASEERLVRMALEDGAAVQSLRFDLPNRTVVAVHASPPEEILRRLEPLGLGASLRGSTVHEAAANEAVEPPDTAGEARVLRRVFAVNAAMFVIELAVGLVAQSTGLIADSLDMFADAAVLALSLFAVGRPQAMKRRAARVAGWLQLALALAALAEVVRRFLFGSEPASTLMIVMGAVALVANAYCLWAMAKRREDGAHMKASYIFLANDVIANGGVILAGVLVAFTDSRYPDLVIGAVVALVVLNGARRILALR